MGSFSARDCSTIGISYRSFHTDPNSYPDQFYSSIYHVFLDVRKQETMHRKTELLPFWKKILTRAYSVM